MRASRGGRAARAAVGVAVGLALLACSKSDEKKGGGANEPAGAAENRQKAAQLTAPAGLFRHIPADTPYVFASFDPIPRSYWQRFGPAVKGLLDAVPPPPESSDPGARFGAAFLRDLRANFDEAGLRKLLGVSPDAHFAIYGVGVLPVLRLELVDSKALLGTIERLQGESGLALPTASVRGRSYWRFASSDVLVVAAVADDQLIVSAGPLAMVDKALPVILGLDTPSPNMADGGPLKALAARHGYAGYGLGYVDSANLLKVLTAASFFQPADQGPAVPPPCAAELGALAGRFPRLAFGYDEISDKTVSMRMVLETESALAARLQQLAVAVPGLGAGPMPDAPLFAAGLGVDLPRARQLGLDAIAGIERIGDACGAHVAEETAGMRAALSEPLPPGLDKVRGVVVSVLNGEMGNDGPRAVEAYAIVAADDPGALLGLIKTQLPPGKSPPVAADGQFHELLPAGTLPGLEAVRAAIKEKTLVAVVGARGADGAEKALGRTGTSPLFYVAYDYGKILEKVFTASNSIGAGERAFLSSFGVVSMWAYPTEHGLSMAMSMGLH